jgi:hypothetical protein
VDYRRTNIFSQHGTVFGVQRKKSKAIPAQSGFGGLEDACWPLLPKFAGSNPAEAFGLFRAKKSPALLPSDEK